MRGLHTTLSRGLDFTRLMISAFRVLVLTIAILGGQLRLFLVVSGSTAYLKAPGRERGRDFRVVVDGHYICAYTGIELFSLRLFLILRSKFRVFFKPKSYTHDLTTSKPGTQNPAPENPQPYRTFVNSSWHFYPGLSSNLKQKASLKKYCSLNSFTCRNMFSVTV